tara:strand:- start:496 stop:693 length:198 start_codon:yes stop_codon:yes gene_type:complete
MWENLTGIFLLVFLASFLMAKVFIAQFVLAIVIVIMIPVLAISYVFDIIRYIAYKWREKFEKVKT